MSNYSLFQNVGCADVAKYKAIHSCSSCSYLPYYNWNNESLGETINIFIIIRRKMRDGMERSYTETEGVT
jgi:hypothetical protein